MRPIAYFFHGWGSEAWVWNGFLPRLQTHCDCFAVDLNSLFTKQGEADFLPGLREIISSQPRPVHLCGWSMGALLALQLALQTPDKVKGLILINGTANFCAPPPAGLPPTAVRKMQRDLRRDLGQTLESFWQMMFTPAEQAQGFLDRYQGLAANMSLDAHFLDYGLRLLLETNLHPALSALATPTLLLHGQEDQICPVGAGQALRQALPQSRLLVLKDAGHALFFTQPEAAAMETAAFIAANEN